MSTAEVRPAEPYLLSYLLPPLVASCLIQRGWWTFVPLVVMLIVLPLIDAAAGNEDHWPVSPELDRNTWFRFLTWFWVAMQLLLMLFVMRLVQTGLLTPFEIVGATLSLGLTTGVVGLAVAHELIHRRYPFERGLGYALLGAVSYSHFALSHVHSHHLWVGTPRDPSTARAGESFYHFFPRTVVGNLRAAWAIERQRLRGARVFSPANRMLRFLAAQVAIYAALLTWIGPVGAVVFAGQALVAILVLEATNYIEHYGLERRRIGDGRYERVDAHHSWDSASRMSSRLLFNLPRHADHHCAAAKRYQSLVLLPRAPRLPAGYGAMFLLALLPPAWFMVMDPRVKKAARFTTPPVLN